MRSRPRIIRPAAIRPMPLSCGADRCPPAVRVCHCKAAEPAKARQSGQPELPDLAAAMQQAAQRGTSGLRRLLGTVASLMKIGGAIWLVASLVLADQFPGLTPVPGIALLFLGFALNNMAKGSPKR